MCRLQVTAMAIFHLLDFGSGFDAMLLAKTGKGGSALRCAAYNLPPNSCNPQL